MSEFKIGDRVRKEAGCRMDGVVVRKFFWEESTDGTYKGPKPDDVAVKWDDGTKGYAKPQWLKKIETTPANVSDGAVHQLGSAIGTFRTFPTNKE